MCHMQIYRYVHFYIFYHTQSVLHVSGNRSLGYVYVHQWGSYILWICLSVYLCVYKSTDIRFCAICRSIDMYISMYALARNIYYTSRMQYVLHVSGNRSRGCVCVHQWGSYICESVYTSKGARPRNLCACISIFIPNLLFRCGLLAWTRFRLILRK